MLTAGVVSLLLAAAMAALFWYGLSGRPNTGPAMGNNSPWPTDIGSEDAPYLPTPVISPAEEFRRNAHRRLSRGARRSS